MNRRKFLKIAGSSAVILAAGGTGFVATRSPTNALKPWKTAGSLYSDPMRRALSYAILAPNPHNRQPWIVDIKSDNEAVLTCDLDRLLAETDPFSRQIIIGLGCFVELFSIAAADQGYRADIEYFPQGEPDNVLDQRPIACLRLIKENTLQRDVLFAQTLQRHTIREPYDTDRPVSDDILQRLRSISADNVIAGTTNDPALLNSLRELTRDALHTEIRTPEAFQESIDLMRIGKAEIEANPDGISLGGAFLESLSLIGVVTRENLADPTSSSFQIGIDMATQGAMTSMGFVWIHTMGNSRTAQIEAGRAYMRICLQATADGLVMQPMSQALQEYKAMAPYYKAVHKQLTRQSGERVQMLARLGFADEAAPAPRWSLETRLKKKG